MKQEIIQKFENLIEDIDSETEALPIEDNNRLYLARISDLLEEGLSKYQDIYNQGGKFKSFD